MYNGYDNSDSGSCYSKVSKDSILVVILLVILVVILVVVVIVVELVCFLKSVIFNLDFKFVLYLKKKLLQMQSF